MTTEVPPRPRPPTRTGPPPDGRVRARWTHVLALGAAAFGVWFLLFAPTLQHNAQVSPVGTRRTVSLDVVGPVAALSRALGLSHIVSATGREGSLPGGTNGLTTQGPTARAGKAPDVGATSHAGAAHDDAPDGPPAPHRRRPVAGAHRGGLARPRHGRRTAVRPRRHRRRERRARRARRARG